MNPKKFIQTLETFPHWIRLSISAWSKGQNGHKIICLSREEVDKILIYKRQLKSMGVKAIFKEQGSDVDGRSGEKFYHYILDLEEL